MMRLTCMRVLTATTGLTVLLLVGCRQGASSVLAGGEPGEDQGTTVDCGGSVYDAD